MDNTLVIKNLDGEDLTIEVVDILEEEDTNKEYICYKLPDMDEIYVSRLVTKEESYTLESVTQEEKEAIEEQLSKQLNSEGE